MYLKLWNALITLQHDPFPAVASLANTVIQYVRSKLKNFGREPSEQRVESAPGTPVNKPMFIVVWDVERSHRVTHWTNNNGGSSCISSLAVLNPGTSHTCVATGCDDGSVRVWQGVFQEQTSSSSPQETAPSLLTSYQASTDVNPATRRILYLR
ncbi:hypothetical protein E2C01_011676 [Portunus trituberculatus]|uniref:Uncharacterized protein n=1 Tax=Portunus trituberculatus TaxID=210409 RepID=A0A5B7DBX5_PORTR|nr:hypothetical protein [Portunus trituberculatus]